MKFNESRLTFRKANVRDAEILSDYRIVFLNEVYGIDSHPDEEQLQIELVEYFTESLRQESVVAWLAEYDSKVVSTSSLVIWDAPLSYSGLGSKGKRGYILNMFTLDGFRKKGIASVLLEKLLSEAKDLALELVTLHATDDGIGVYKKIGFEESVFPELTFKL